MIKESRNSDVPASAEALVMRKLLSTLAVVALVGVLGAGTAEAGTYAGTVQITCTDVTAAGTGTMTLDRDNTGTGNEAMNITVTDGNDTVLYTLDFQNALGDYAAGLLNTTAYTTPPAVNPITFTLTSVAGNGLPAQVDVTSVGSCGTLAWVAPDAAAPSTGTQGQTIAVTGAGCPAGVVTAELHAAAGDGNPLASGTDTVADTNDPYSIDLAIPANAPVGAGVIEVFCGPAADPVSASQVLAFTVVAAETPTTPTTPTTESTTTTARPATSTAPKFTG